MPLRSIYYQTFMYPFVTKLVAGFRFSYRRFPVHCSFVLWSANQKNRFFPLSQSLYWRPPADQKASGLWVRDWTRRWREKFWRPKAAYSVLSFRLGNLRIDRILHFYYVFVLFASYEDISLLADFFSRKVERYRFDQSSPRWSTLYNF